MPLLLLNFTKAITCSLDNKKKPHPNSNPLENGQKERANVKIIRSLNDHKHCYFLYPGCLMSDGLWSQMSDAITRRISRGTLSNCHWPLV